MARPSYTSKNQKLHTKWLKNAMRSIGASYGDNIKSLAPNLSEISTSGVRTAASVARSFRTNQHGINNISNSLKKNKYVQFAQTAYKNALVDLKSGNFNNQERSFASFSEGTAEAVEEAMSGFTFGDDGADNVNVNVIAGDGTGLAALSSQMQEQAVVSAKMQKANMDAFIAVNAASMQQTGQIGAEIVSQLTNINSQLAAMVQYNNSTMNKYIEASLAYYEKVGSSFDKKKGKDDDRVTAMDVLASGTKGGINLGRYKAYVKQEFKSMVNNSDFGMIKALLDNDMFMQEMMNNPLGALTRGFTAYMTPTILKTTLEQTEATLNNALVDIGKQVADLAKDQSGGLGGMLKRAIGEAFGLKVDRQNSFKGATVERGAIPFDGETKHAITEIITKELRTQTQYLEIIASHYKSNARDHAKKNAEIWDWNQNKYIKGSDVTGSITDKMMQAVYDSVSSTYFGKNLSGVINQGKTQKGKDEIELTLKEFYSLMEQNVDHLELKDLLAMVQQTNGSKQSKDLIKTWLKKMKRQSPNDFNNRSTAQISSQSAMKELREEIMQNPTLYHLYDSEYNGVEDIDAKFRELVFNKDNQRKGRKNQYTDITNDSYKEAKRSSKAGKSYSEKGKTQWGQKVSASISNAGGHIQGMLNAIMNGDPIGVLQERGALLKDQFSIFAGDIKKALFGERTDGDVFKNGLFSGVANGFTDVVNSLKYRLTGQEYVDSKGKTHKQNDDTVLGRLTKVGETVKDEMMLKIFGRAKDENGDYQKAGHGVIDSITDGFKEVSNTFKEFVFGKEGDKYNKGLLANVKNTFNENFYRNHKASGDDEETKLNTDFIAKAGAGAAAGGLLGFMVGGPLVGALTGLTLSVYKNSDKFKEFLFGKEDGLTLADGTKRKKEGLFGKIGNYLNAGIIEPMKKEFKYIGKDITSSLKHDILAPIGFAVEYGAGKLGSFFGGIGDKVKEGVDTVGGFFGAAINKMFPGAIVEGGNLLTKTFHAVYTAGATIVKAPFKLVGALVKALDLKDRISRLLSPVTNMIKTGVNGVFSFTKGLIKDAIFNPVKWAGRKIKGAATFVKNKVGTKWNNSRIGKFSNKVANAYRSYDNILGENDSIISQATGGQFTEDSQEAREWLAENKPEVLGQLKSTFSTRMALNSRERNLEKAKNKKILAMGRRSDKNAQKIAKWTRGQFSEDSPEARQWLLQHAPDKLKELDTEAYAFNQELKQREKEEREGMSTRGMNETTLVNASLSRLSETGQQTSLLAKIYDILFKQFDEEGHDENQANNEEEENKNKPPKTGDRRRRLKGKYSNEYVEEEYDSQTGWHTVDKSKDDINPDEESRNHQDNPNDKLFGNTRANISKFINWIKGGHGQGRSRVIFGGRGPEDSEHASDEDRAKRKAELISKTNANGVTKTTESERTAIAREENADARSDSMRDATGKALSASAQIKERKENRFREKVESLLSNVSTFTEKVAEESETHRIEWGKIFSKKGLITGLVVGGAMLLVKHFPGVITALGKVIGTIAKGVAWLSRLFTSGKQEDNDSGKSAGEVLADIGKNAASGNILQLRDDGTASSLSEPIAKAMARTGFNIGKGAFAAAHGLPAVSKASKFIAKHAPGKLTRLAGKMSNIQKGIGSVGYKTITGAKNLLSKGGTEVVQKTAQELMNDATMDALYEASTQGAAKIASESVDDVAKSAASTGKKTILKYADDFIEFITKKFTAIAGSTAGKVLSKPFSLLKSGINNLGDTAVDKLVKKISETAASKGGGAALTLGLSEAVFATIGAVNGVSGTAKLFKCKFDDVDATMKVISGIFGALTGTMLGSIVDIILSVVSAATGVDILNALAVAMYKKIVGEDSEKASKLESSQAELYGDYSKERDSAISSQYETQKKAGLISSDVTLEQFTAGISDGTYKVNYEGFDDYNTRVNASLGDKAISAIGGGLHKAGSAIGSAKNYIFGGEKTYTDKNGNTYKKNDQGGYDVYQNGKSIGSIAKNALPSDAVEQKSGSGLVSDLKSVGGKIATAAGNAKEAIGEEFTNIVNAGSQVLDSVKEKAGSIKDGLSKAIDNLKNGGKEVATNVKDYLIGKKESIDFGLADDNPMKPLMDVASMGLQMMLSPIKTIASAVSSIKDTVGDKLSSAKDTVSGFFSNIASAFTGKTGGAGGRGPGMSLNGGTYYSQADPRWGGSAFGYDGATMRDTGCGPTAAAMAFSDITGRNISPISMAGLAQATGNRDSTGTNWNFINDASSAMGMNSTQIIRPDSSDLVGALASGNPVILSGNSGGFGTSPYTSQGHYVVATGFDKNGNVLINDPRGTGYSGRYNLNDLVNTTGSIWTFGGRGMADEKGRRESYGKKVVAKPASDTATIIDSQTPTSGPDWLSICAATKKALAESKPGYYTSNGKKYVKLTVNGKSLNTRTDCTGYTSACVYFYCDQLKSQPASQEWVKAGGSVEKALTANGFKKYAWPGWDKVAPGDILCIYNGKSHHCEIFAANSGGTPMVYSCGSTSSINNPSVTKSGYIKKGFSCIYRPDNPGNGATSYDVTGLSAYDGSTTTTTTETTTSKPDIFSALSGFMSSFASKAMTGMFTGNYNTDYSDVFGTSTTSAPVSQATAGASTFQGGTVSPVNTSSTEMTEKAWKYLRSKGLSANATAGLMG